jgi:hypothetical protein
MIILKKISFNLKINLYKLRNKNKIKIFKFNQIFNLRLFDEEVYDL